MESTAFSLSREARNRFCREKDQVLRPILKELGPKDPSSFTAILMPSLYGLEAYHLVEQGVPTHNLFAIEDNSAEETFDPPQNVHEEIVHCRRPDRQELTGMRTTDRPARVLPALDEAWYAFGKRPFNLIYLDFLSQPNVETHYRCLKKILHVPMLVPGGTLILNFGRNRCYHVTVEFNRNLARLARVCGISTTRDKLAEVLVGSVLATTTKLEARAIYSKSYISYPVRIKFTTTVAKF